MQFMSSWATNDKRTLLHFSTATLETFCLHVQASDADCEAGGLLLGSVHGAHMLIEQATVPTAWDKRFRYLFERMPFGHEVIALSRWTARHCFDAGAALEQISQHVGAQAVGAFREFARFLQWLTHAHLAEHFQQRSLWCRDPWFVVALLERPGMKWVVWRLVEQALAVVLGRKSLGEPIRKAGGRPTVELQNGLLRQVLPHPQPCYDNARQSKASRFAGSRR